MKIFRSFLPFYLIHFVLVVISFILFCFLQFLSYSGEPDVEWEKYLNRSDGSVWCEYGKQTNDNGYISAGFFRTNDYYDYWYIYLIKTDYLGNKEWDKIYNDGEEALSVCQTSDGGYILTGAAPECYLLKTDSLGNKLWIKNYNGHEGYEVLQTNDGGYIIAGMNDELITLKFRGYLLKTDSYGNVEWENIIDFDNCDISFSSVKQTIDNGYIVVGYIYPFANPPRDVLLMKFDSLGNQEWFKTYGDSESDIGTYISNTSDGGYIIIGCADDFGKIYLVKTDSFGNKQWEKKIYRRAQENGACVQETNDGGYILTGFSLSDSMGGEQDTYIVKTNNIGDIEWEKIMYDEYGGHDGGCAIQQTTDGGYFIASYSNRGIYLINLGPDKQVPPLNDNFSDAIRISGPSGQVTGNNSEATKETGEPNHAGNTGGKSIWYKWQPPNSGNCTFNTYGSSFDTLLAIYTGSSVDSLTYIASNDNNGGNLQSLVNFRVYSESEYNVAIDGNNGDSGNIVLKWNLNYIKVYSPNEGENWVKGTTKYISWSSGGNVGADVRMTLWKDDKYFTTITSSTPNDGNYLWTIMGSIPIGSGYKIRITSNSDNSVYDIMDTSFSIVAPLTVTSPLGGENWYCGEVKNVSWTTSGYTCSNVRITLWKGNQYYTHLTYDVPNSGSYYWSIPMTLPTSSEYKIRITSISDESVYDFCDKSFAIGAPIAVIAPNGGEEWRKGTTKNIKWTFTDNSNSNVRITLWKDDQYYTTLINSTENDGIYCWIIPKSLPVDSNYKVRVTSLKDNSINDFSDDCFSITGGIKLTAPNGGESWQMGMPQDITWISDCGEDSYVRITLWKQGGYYATIDNHTKDDGLYTWTVSPSLILGFDYKVRITSAADDTIYDYSDSYFGIISGLNVTSPNGNEKWQRGTTQTITWNTNAGLESDVKITLWENNQYYTHITYSAVNDGSYEWAIPEWLPAGSDYKIRITFNSMNSIYDFSDGYFEIE